MKCLVAFKTDKQAYVLPVSQSSDSILILTQPKFLSLEQSANLPMLIASGEKSEWVSRCNKSALLSSNQDRQRIYCWWMALSLDERNVIYEASLYKTLVN